jgi:hypothetical protein
VWLVEDIVAVGEGIFEGVVGGVVVEERVIELNETGTTME